MKRSEKENFVKDLKDDIINSSSLVVSNYSGITVKEAEELRKEMRKNGTKFKVTKNRLTKLALKGTQFENILDLFKGPTAIAYSEDAVAPAKISVNFENKLEKFQIIGGSYGGQKIDKERINFLATLPSLDELRGKLIGLISAPAQKITSIMNEPGGKLARIVSIRSNNMKESN